MMSPIKLFMYIICIVLFIMTVFIAAQIFMEFRVVAETRHVERFSAELAENILTSELTVEKSVLDENQLDMYNSYRRKNIEQIEETMTYRGVAQATRTSSLFAGSEEPAARHCKYGYHVTIEDYDAKEQQCRADSDCDAFCSDVCGLSEDDAKKFDAINGVVERENCKCADGRCQCKNYEGHIVTKPAWEFGYATEEATISVSLAEEPEINYVSPQIKHISKKYPVSIAVKTASGYEHHLGSMTLDVYDTWLSEISCLAESAWKTKQTQRMTIPCINIFPKNKISSCYIAIRKSGDYLCIYDKDRYLYPYLFSRDPSIEYSTTDVYDVECRHLPGVSVETFDAEYAPGKSQYRTLKAVPIKAGAAPDCSGDNAASGDGDVGTIMLCLGE